MSITLAEFQTYANEAKVTLDANNAELSSLAQKVAAIDPQDPEASSKLQELERQKGETLKSIKARSVTVFRELNAFNKEVPPADLAAADLIYNDVLSYNRTSLGINYDQCDLALIAKTAQINAPVAKVEPKVDSPTQPASTAEVKAELPPADSVAGVGTSGFGNKVEEGLLSAESKFGPKIPFDKPTCLASDFKELANPVAIAQSQGKSFVSPVLDNLISNQVKPKANRATASSVNSANPTNKGEDKSHLVTLEDNEGNLVEFLVMPEIVENRSAEYEPVAPPQFPGAFQKYKGTSSVQWQINATFISRTTPEATQNLINLNILRGWTMPYFGDKIKKSFTFSEKLGAPPPVLIFKGFRSAIIGPVPVVITSLSWNWPRDVDYIPAESPDPKSNTSNIPFPTVMSIAINVVESFSTEQFNNFDLEAYRVGDFDAAFNNNQSTIGASENDDLMAQYEKIKFEGGLTKGQTDTILQRPEEAQTIEGSGWASKARKAQETLSKVKNPLSVCERKAYDSAYVSSTVEVIRSAANVDIVSLAPFRKDI